MAHPRNILAWTLGLAVGLATVVTIVSLVGERNPFHVVITNKIVQENGRAKKVTVMLTNVSSRTHFVIVGIKRIASDGQWEECTNSSGDSPKALSVRPRSRPLGSHDSFTLDASIPDEISRLRVWVLSKPEPNFVLKRLRRICIELGLLWFQGSTRQYTFEVDP